jgi:hypothetical protein
MTALAALPWIPDELTADLQRWRASPLWEKAAGPYGLRPFRVDPRDQDREWFGADLIGIDVGAFAVSLANQRAASAWRLWEKHPVAQAAFQRLRISIPN